MCACMHVCLCACMHVYMCALTAGIFACLSRKLCVAHKQKRKLCCRLHWNTFWCRWWLRVRVEAGLRWARLSLSEPHFLHGRRVWRVLLPAHFMFRCEPEIIIATWYWLPRAKVATVTAKNALDELSIHARAQKNVICGKHFDAPKADLLTHISGRAINFWYPTEWPIVFNGPRESLLQVNRPR